MTTRSEITISEAAKRLTCSPDHIENLIRDNLFITHDISRKDAKRANYRIDEASFNEWVRSRKVSF